MVFVIDSDVVFSVVQDFTNITSFIGKRRLRNELEKGPLRVVMVFAAVEETAF